MMIIGKVEWPISGLSAKKQFIMHLPPVARLRKNGK
jgi:hypothetical protein